MCDPLTFLAAAGAGLGAASKIGGGLAQSGLDQFSAQIAAANAEISDAKGAQTIGRIAGKVNDAVSAAQRHFAAAGLDPTNGSPLLTQLDSVLQGQGDMQTARARAAQERAGAVSQEAQSLIKSKQDMMSGYLGAGTSLLSGLSSVKGASWPWSTGATGQSSFLPSMSFLDHGFGFGG